MDTRKCKLKFIFLDIFVLVCLLFFFFSYRKREKGNDIPIEYTMLFTVDAHMSEAFHSGAVLLDGVGKGVCGYVKDVKEETAYTENAEGIFPDVYKKRLFVTVRGQGREKNGRFTVGSIAPLVGRHFYFHSPCVTEGICLEVHTL